MGSSFCRVAFALGILAGTVGCSSPKPVTFVEVATQRPWTNSLPIPATYVPGTNPSYPGSDYYEIHVTAFQQAFGIYEAGSTRPLATKVWGYGQVGQTYDTGVRDPSGAVVRQSGAYIAPTLIAERGRPVVVKWIDDRRNADGSPMTRHLLEAAYDTTLHGTSDHEPHVRMITHLHGAEVASESDGFPHFWYTPDPSAAANGMGGPAGNFIVDTYPNEQQSATLWYHDHSMGITRLNVMAMGAGMYILRDSAQEAALGLPSGAYEIPLVIADRMFQSDGSLAYLNDANPPSTQYHPQLPAEFFGNVITVNGMAWPYLEVEPRKYRFRVLNASNARMYNLRLVDSSGALVPHVVQIGTDGGYLNAPVSLDMAPIDPKNDHTATTNQLFLAPAERADIVIDFSTIAPGTTLTFANDAPAPFPDGNPVDPASTGQVLQFRVVPLTAPDTSQVPSQLATLSTRLDASQVSVTRHLVLVEVDDPVTGMPVVGLLNNTCFEQPVTETPKLGATELWEIVNATDDTHPIHLHLVQFNLLERQSLDRGLYLADWNTATGTTHGSPGPAPTCVAMTDPITPPGVTTAPQQILPATRYLTDFPTAPAANEAGWKDTVRVKDETVTRLLVRFAPQDPAASGTFGGYVFDPTTGNYVWHCHILEHEDNEMMRPYRVQP